MLHFSKEQESRIPEPCQVNAPRSHLTKIYLPNCPLLARSDWQERKYYMLFLVNPTMKNLQYSISFRLPVLFIVCSNFK